MGRRRTWMGLMALVAIGIGQDARAGAEAAQPSDPESEMSEDVRRMHERLTALSKGEGARSELRVEILEGSGAAHRSLDLEAGVLTSTEWKAPGAPMVHREGRVPEARVARLLEQLIAKRYWRFQGTRFVPDAPVFLFRFYYGDLSPVDFRCDLEEVRNSSERREIRDLFLTLVSETQMKTVSPEP